MTSQHSKNQTTASDQEYSKKEQPQPKGPNTRTVAPIPNELNPGDHNQEEDKR